MSSPKSLVRSLASAAAFGLAAALGAGVAASQAQAADLGLPGEAELPSLDRNVEFGTGWYIRGSVAWALQTQPSLQPDFTSVPSSHSSDWALEIGSGYQFNKWFRTDLSYTYYGPQKVSGNGAFVNCPASLDPLYHNPADPTTLYGVAPDPSQCTPQQSASLQKNLLLANGFIDLGTWYGVTPYVGAGIGAAYIRATESVNFVNNSSGTTYNATLTLPNPYPVPLIYYNPTTGLPFNPQPHYNTGVQNWNFSNSTQKFSFAFALMGGVAYDLTSNMKLDIGYRYVNFGSFSGISSLSGALFSNQITTQEIRVGLRYMID
jgi:opacity protein-like surface antigen